MGYNATVVFSLDTIDMLARDPDFGAKLQRAILWRANNGPGEPRYNHYPEPYVGPGVSVVECHHADYQSIVTVGGNCGRLLYVGTDDSTGYVGGYRATDDDLIKELNRRRVARAREAKKNAKQKTDVS